MKIWIAWCFGLVANTSLHAQPVVINEVMYSNQHVIFDAEGDAPDYIELYNNGDQPLNLHGFQLIDNLAKSNYWVFPEVTIAPKSVLLVFASGKDKTGGDKLHTHFKLGLMEESVYLLNPQGICIDSISKQCVPPNTSFGRKPDGSSNRGLLTPTPGKSNNTAEPVHIDYQPDSIGVNYPSGFYRKPISVIFSNNNPANTIRYTLDGDLPDADEAEYSGPLYLEDITPNENRFAGQVEEGDKPGDLILKGNIVRAQVFSHGCPASDVLTHTYFIREATANHYPIPVVSLITDEDNLFDNETGIYVAGEHNNFTQRGKDWERPAHIEVLDTGGNGVIKQDAGIRIHGRGSRYAPQKSFRLYAREEYGDSLFDYPLFQQKPHLQSYERLLLRTTRDWVGVLFLDDLCQELVEPMNIDNVATQPVILFVNGEYWGIYSLREHMDEHYIRNNHGYPADPTIVEYEMYEGAETSEGDEEAYDRLIQWFEFNDPQNDLYFDELSRLIDISGVVDFFAAHLYLANTDFPNNNIRMWKARPDTSRWRYLFFDLDAAMIRVEYDHLTEYNNTIEDYQRYPEWSTYVFRNMMQNAEFRQIFTQRFYHHLKHSFSPQKVISAIERYEKLYEPLIGEHCYRWDKPKDYLDWQKNVSQIKTFAVQRPLAVSEQLSGNMGSPFTIYPVPSKGRFTVQTFSEPVDGNIRIVDMTGKPVYSDVIRNKTNVFDLDLWPGIYQVQVQLNGFWFTEKLLINP